MCKARVPILCPTAVVAAGRFMGIDARGAEARFPPVTPIREGTRIWNSGTEEGLSAPKRPPAQELARARSRAPAQTEYSQGTHRVLKGVITGY